MQTQRRWGWKSERVGRGKHLLLSCRGERVGGSILRGGWGAGWNRRHGTALFQQLYGLCMMLIFDHKTFAPVEYNWSTVIVFLHS